VGWGRFLYGRQARLAELVTHPDMVRDLLCDGARCVRPQAQATLAEVREKMGLGVEGERYGLVRTA
jgi:hypothetical protein